MKRLNKAHSGSLVLMILIVMTALIIIVHSMSRSSFYLAALARERTK